MRLHFTENGAPLRNRLKSFRRAITFKGRTTNLPNKERVAGGAPFSGFKERMQTKFVAATTPFKGGKVMGWFAIIGAVVGMVGGLKGAVGGVLSLRDSYTKGRPIASFTMTTHHDRSLLAIRVMNTTQMLRRIAGVN
jgi:hypothetical protein